MTNPIYSRLFDVVINDFTVVVKDLVDCKKSIDRIEKKKEPAFLDLLGLAFNSYKLYLSANKTLSDGRELCEAISNRKMSAPADITLVPFYLYPINPQLALLNTIKNRI